MTLAFDEAWTESTLIARGPSSGTLDDHPRGTARRVPRTAGRIRGVPKPLDEIATFGAWLEGLGGAPWRLPLEHTRRVTKVWRALRRTHPKLGAPVAGTTSEGALQLAWSTEAILVEIDILPAGIGWFARDRRTGKYDGAEEPSADLPPAAHEWLARTAAR